MTTRLLRFQCKYKYKTNLWPNKHLHTTKTWPLVNEFCWNWVQLTQPLKSIGFGIKVQSVFWSSRRRRLPRTEQEMIWTNQKLPLMIHVLWPGFPFSFSLCSGPMRKDCCFDSAVQEVLCITWEVSDREIAWVVPKPLTSGYVFVVLGCVPMMTIHCHRPVWVLQVVACTLGSTVPAIKSKRWFFLR